MTAIKLFPLRSTLIDINPQASREREVAANVGTVVKVIGFVGFSLSLVPVFGISSQDIPSALCIAVPAILGAVSFADVYVIGRNIENMMTSNIFSRTFCAANSENFTRAITKDTLIAGPFFGPQLVRFFEKETPFS